jgi:hypothetical protein
MFTYANTCKKALEIHFTYLSNKEIHCIFKTGRIVSVLFSTTCHLFYNFIFLCSGMFFINHALKFKYQPSRLEVKGNASRNNTLVLVIWLRYVIIASFTDVFVAVCDTTGIVFRLLHENLLNIFSFPIIVRPVSDCPVHRMC